MEGPFVPVNEYMETNVPNVFAGGDLVIFPLKPFDRSVNIGHWQIAQRHGKTAAVNMVAQKDEQREEIKTTPYFWSIFMGKGLRFAGHLNKHDEVVIEGDLDSLKMIIYYIK